MKDETGQLLNEGRIAKSCFSRRAQPLVVDDKNRMERKCIDYSQTINLFTDLSAYSLPRVESTINKVVKWKCIDILDLKSSYRQIQIISKDRPCTSFQEESEQYH